MPSKNAKHASELRPGTSGLEPSHHSTGGFSSTVSGIWRGSVRQGRPRMDSLLQAAGRQDGGAGLVSGRGKRSSGSGSADGHTFGHAGRGADSEGPRFDLSIPETGYGWWYADAISDDGTHGFSIIAMIGSVFSPYYAWAGRKDPKNHVGLNVGLYGGGKKRWTLTERGRNDIIQERHYLKIGPSELVWKDGCLTVEINEWANPILRRVRGTIRLFPQGLVTTPFMLDDNSKHFWQPLGAVSRVEVEFDNPSLKWSGDAYIDSNWGSEPLETGFRYWDWSRGHVNEKALILYDAFTRMQTNRQFGLRISPNGEVEQIEIPDRHSLHPGPIWRVKRSTLADTGTQPRTVSMLEDTPFYTRSHINTSVHGETFTAVHESLDLDRFSKNWVRCLLPFRMPRVSAKD